MRRYRKPWFTFLSFSAQLLEHMEKDMNHNQKRLWFMSCEELLAVVHLEVVLVRNGSLRHVELVLALEVKVRSRPQ